MKKSKKNENLISLFVVTAVLILFFVSVLSKSNEPIRTKEEAIKAGEACIRQNFPNQNFSSDPYIYCSGNEGCQYFRVKDIQIMLSWFDSDRILPEYQQWARKAMAEWSKDSENKEISFSYLYPEYNETSDKPGTVAMESACLVGLFTENSKIAQSIYNDFRSGKNISARQKTFRNVVDETWCIALMANFYHNDSFVASLAMEKERQMKGQIDYSGQIAPMIEIYVPVHFFIMNGYLERNGYSILDKEYFIKWHQELMKKYEKEITPNELCNSAFVLARHANLSNGYIEELEQRILEEQGADGCWSSFKSVSFGTLHCMLALEEMA